MRKSFGFCDLCVNSEAPNEKELEILLQRLFEMGYSTVAINQTVHERIFENDKKSKKKTTENDAPVIAVPTPINVEELNAKFTGKLCILSRITFIFSDPTRTHTLNQSLNLRKFDLYAVVPKTQTAFQYACSQLSADIITLNKECTGIKLSRKMYLQAAERGIHFEIQYCDVIDTSSRKLAIHNSHLFHMFGKSKNVIITSGASTPYKIRSPYDIMNLASILGLNETKAKASILSQSRHLILKAEGRRYGKAIFHVQSSIREGKEFHTDTETKLTNKGKNGKRIKLQD